MKYIKKYKIFELAGDSSVAGNPLYKNRIDESKSDVSDENIIEDVVFIMQDIIDDYRNIKFTSINSDPISVDDIYNKSSNLNNYKTTIRTGGVLRSKFGVDFGFIEGGYEKYVSILSDMISVIRRLKDIGWDIDRLDDVFRADGFQIYYQFTKPDVIVNEYKFDKNEKEKLEQAFEDRSLSIEEIDEEEGDYENWLKIRFSTHAYSGELSSYDVMNRKFEWICDVMGFESYAYDNEYYVDFSFIKSS